MQNLDGKKTQLDDDAEIYKVGAERSDNKSAGQHWKELDTKGKWQYFANYYLVYVVAILAGVFFLAYILYSALRPKPKELGYIVILDCELNTNKADAYFQNVTKELGYTTKEATITLNTGLSSAQHMIADTQALSTYFFAGTVDVLITKKEIIGRYAQIDILYDIRDILPDDIKAALKEEDYFTYHFVPDVHAAADAVERDIVVGICIDGLPFIEETKYVDGATNYVWSFVRSGDGVKTGDSFRILRSLLGLPQVEQE